MDSQRILLDLAESDSEEDFNPTNHNLDATEPSEVNSCTNTVPNQSSTSVPAPKFQTPQTISNVPCVANVSNKNNVLFALIGKMLDESESKNKQSSSSASISLPLPVPKTVEQRPPLQLGGIATSNPGKISVNPSVVKGTGFTMPDPPSAPSYQVPVRRNPSNATLGMRRSPVQQSTVSSRIHFILNILFNTLWIEPIFCFYFIVRVHYSILFYFYNNPFENHIVPSKNMPSDARLSSFDGDEPDPHDYDNLMDYNKYYFLLFNSSK